MDHFKIDCNMSMIFSSLPPKMSVVKMISSSSTPEYATVLVAVALTFDGKLVINFNTFHAHEFKYGYNVIQHHHAH